VPEGAAGGLRFSVLEGGEWKSLSGAAFELFVDGSPAADGDEIALGEGRDSATVLFRRAGIDGELIERSYTFRRGSYEVAARVSLRREGDLARTEAYAIGWECGLQPTEPDLKGDLRKFAALGKVGEELYKADMGKFGKETRREYEGTVVWAGARTKYFFSALITEAGRRGGGTLALLGDRAENRIGFGIGYPFRGDPRLVEDAFTWYAGPLDMKALSGYGLGLEKAIDMGYLRFLSVGILRLMVWTKQFIPNYGVIIIIISVLTKLLFYRLTHKSFKSMKDMQRLQPRIKEIQEKWKGDRDRLNKEIMKAYKEAGVSPLGGCLPLLLQMPVFIALYNALGNTIELRGAPFVGWIDDLSMPDTLFRWGANVPILGNEFHLLPILMGAAMIAQSKLGGSPTGGGAPAAQTKMMNWMMPIVFTIFFYGMPSGLVLYWLVNQVLSVAQQYIVQREIESGERDRALAGAER
jgi:YidC/Oxa1 family membrane protein insertase